MSLIAKNFKYYFWESFFWGDFVWYAALAETRSGLENRFWMWGKAMRFL